MDNKNFNDAIKNLNEHLQPNKDKRRNQIEKCQIDILNILLEEGWSKTFENYRFDLRTSKKRSDQYNLAIALHPSVRFLKISIFIKIYYLMIFCKKLPPLGGSSSLIHFYLTSNFP